MKNNQPHGILAVVKNPKGEMLLLKRSPDKKHFPNMWAVVAAGPVSADTNMRKFTLEEIKNETGLEAEIVMEGKSFTADIGDQKWKLHVFLANGSGNVVLNHEHSEYAWVDPNDLSKYNLVPGREKIFMELMEK